jgi:hypothetical protein
MLAQTLLEGMKIRRLLKKRTHLHGLKTSAVT